MKLSDREWKAFNVTDIFDHIQRGKRLKNADHIPGNRPYVSSSALNNGVADWIKPTDKSRVFGESISLANSGSVGTAFYEPFKYVASDHITSFHLKNGSKLVYLFMATCLEKQKHNFGFNREVNEDRLKRLRLMLPINNQGQPDYQFMADYEQELIQYKRKQYLAYAKKQLEHVGNTVKTTPLNDKQWAPFFLNEIFDVNPGVRLTNQNKKPGNNPFIGAVDNSNGVTGFVGNTNKSDDSNVLGVNYNGAPGIAFYHPYTALFSDDVKRLKLKDSAYNTKNVLLFMKAIIMKQRGKYSYGYKFNASRMNRQKLYVPVNDQGRPDYDYMEQYVKNLMIKKYQSYLDYVKQH